MDALMNLASAAWSLFVATVTRKRKREEDGQREALFSTITTDQQGEQNKCQGRAGAANSMSAKRLRTVERDSSGREEHEVEPSAGAPAGPLPQTPDAKCVFLQMRIGSLNRDQHIRRLNSCATATPKLLSKKLEEMERERDGVERSKHEMEKRIDTLKDEGKIALVRQYVDRLHGGSNRLTDEFDRKELRNIPLREEEEEEYDQEEEHDSPPPMEGQQLFP